MDLLRAARELLAIRPYHRRLGRLATTLSPVSWTHFDYGTHVRQYGLAATQAEPGAPVAVYLHGGGWQFGSPELLQAFGAHFYRRGYHVLMVSHRRLFRHDGRQVLADVAAGLRKGFGESGPLPPTPHRRLALLAGVSSGGHLAALLALRQNLWRGDGTTVAGLLACAAPLSLRAMGRTPTRMRFAGRPNRDRWRELDPVRHLTSRPDFPAVIVHGARDALVPVACSQEFVSRAADLEWADCAYHELPGGGHLSGAEWIFGA